MNHLPGGVPVLLACKQKPMPGRKGGTGPAIGTKEGLAMPIVIVWFVH